MSGDKSIILFDGVCNLCNASVDFIITRDAKDQFRFGGLQELEGQKILSKFNVPPTYLDSLVLIEKDKIFFRSTAALRIAKKLRGLWSFFFVFILIPTPLRDWIYNWIGKNRYRWFGKKSNCRIPTDAEKEKFLNYLGIPPVDPISCMLSAPADNPEP
jgi:predicted DCC family thiol-disulfide oxidoreductase YuxK